jgi:hypothetical protein
VPDIDTDSAGPDTNGPDTITRGNVYTCTSGFNSFYPGGSLSGSCSNQLAINGSLIAQNIFWLRTLGTLSASSASERPDFSDGLGGTSAAEVINYSPEMYLGPSPLKQPADGPGYNSVGAYDSITTMPPVF